MLTAVCDFVARIDVFDPAAPTYGDLELRLGGQDLRLTLRAPVAEALIEALRSYHDPRDRGPCDHCGGPRLDDNFLCRDCGGPSGVFGQMIAERAARYADPTAIGSPSAAEDGPAATRTD